MLLSSVARLAFKRNQKLLIILGLTVLAYYAAISRAQVFTWVIASLLLSALVTGYLWPRWLLRNVSISRNGPERAEEGEKVVFDVEIKNHGLIPRFMIQAVDQLPFLGAASGDISQNHQILGLVAYIPSSSSFNFSVSVLCEKRGIYQLGPVGLSSSFPLGLWEARQNKNGGTQSITIYPDIFPIIGLPLLGTPSEIHRGGLLLPKGSGSAEFSGLREYRRGDNPRHIHWPTTARSNTLMVKEFEPLASASLNIIMNLSKDSNIGFGKHSSFEYAVRTAASISRYATDHDMPIEVSAFSDKLQPIGLGTGETHFKSILDFMATVDSISEQPYAKVIQQAAMNIRYGQTAVIFISEPKKHMADTIESIALLQARGANVLAIVFDTNSFINLASEFPPPWSKLFDLGIESILIKKDDDLTRLFNP